MIAKYHSLLDKLEPFVVCYNLLEKKRVFNQKISDQMIFNPVHRSSHDFINKLYRLDQLSFGEQGMGMEKWVFFDCAAMPGFVMGFAINADSLDPKDQLLIGQTQGFFPISMYIAIPTQIEGTWFGHNLSSLNSTLVEPLDGLGTLTKLAALDFFSIKKLQGASQWNSPSLGIHTRFGDLKLLSAFTPIHSKAETYCYECEVQLDLKPTVVQSNFSYSLPNIQKLQRRIEAGEQIKIKAFSKKDKIEII